jgi:hypothetical protein
MKQQHQTGRKCVIEAAAKVAQEVARKGLIRPLSPAVREHDRALLRAVDALESGDLESAKEILQPMRTRTTGADRPCPAGYVADDLPGDAPYVSPLLVGQQTETRVAEDAATVRIRGTFAPAHERETLFAETVAITNADAYRDGTIRVDSGGWIRGEDRLPAEGEVVLIYYIDPYNNTPRITLAQMGGYRGAMWHDLTNDEGIAGDPDNVTHWRPLPDPPATPDTADH